jgi:hypothetical protein
MWPIHQINWQKSRYNYDLYFSLQNSSREVYQYCIDQKLIDAALIAKWKKTGYERLCSAYVINPTKTKFGTTSICRVPLFDRSADAKNAQDPTTGCMDCARIFLEINMNKTWRRTNCPRRTHEEITKIMDKAALEAKAAAGDEETDVDSEATDGSSESEDDYGN